MQLGNIVPPPPSIIAPLSATAGSNVHSMNKEFSTSDKDAISALESIRPWSANLPTLPRMSGAMDAAVSVANAAAHAHAQAQVGVAAALVAAASSQAEETIST